MYVIEKDEEEDRIDRDQTSKVQFSVGPVPIASPGKSTRPVDREYEQKGVRCIVQTFFKDYLTDICN